MHLYLPNVTENYLKHQKENVYALLLHFFSLYTFMNWGIFFSPLFVFGERSNTCDDDDDYSDDDEDDDGDVEDHDDDDDDEQSNGIALF